MAMQIDLERLLAVAQATGALNGNTPGYGPMRLPQMRGKEASLTLSTMASLYGCCGLFDPCGSNDLLSLTLDSEPFLDWMGWRANNECRQFVKLLTYIGPAGTAAGTEGTGGRCGLRRCGRRGVRELRAAAAGQGPHQAGRAGARPDGE